MNKSICSVVVAVLLILLSSLGCYVKNTIILPALSLLLLDNKNVCASIGIENAIPERGFTPFKLITIGPFADCTRVEL